MRNADIEEALKKSKEELFNLRFQAATSQLDNNSRLKAVKKDIARMYTVLREREVGISEEPAETVKVEKKPSKAKAKAEKAEETAELEAPLAQTVEVEEPAEKTTKTTKKTTAKKASSETKQAEEK
jgi:large subunit ribosomal protein L29